VQCACQLVQLKGRKKLLIAVKSTQNKKNLNNDKTLLIQKAPNDILTYSNLSII